MHPLDCVLPISEVWIMFYLLLGAGPQGEGLAGTRSSECNNAIGQD
jgi:hypothetical protein